MVSNQDGSITVTVDVRMVARGEFDGNSALNLQDIASLQTEIVLEAQTNIYHPFYDVNTDG